MPVLNITLQVPDDVYEDLKKEADASNHTVEDILLERIEIKPTPTESTNVDKLPPELQELIDSMTYYSDKNLWKAARTRASVKSSRRSESLHFKRQREGALTPEETQELAELLKQFDRIMLTRAQAAVLLKQRGYDITELGPKRR